MIGYERVKLGENRLWIGGYGPERSSHGAGLATFKRIVEAETNGEVTVDITWNIMDEGRPNTHLFELVEAGEMFFCYFSTSYQGRRVPELNVLETPFLFDNLEMAHSALDGALGDRLRDAVRRSTGFELLGCWDNGFRHFTNRLRPVRDPEDCKGMTVRMQPNEVHEALIRSWGAEPVTVELSEAIRLISNLEVADKIRRSRAGSAWRWHRERSTDPHAPRGPGVHDGHNHLPAGNQHPPAQSQHDRTGDSH